MVNDRDSMNLWKVETWLHLPDHTASYFGYIQSNCHDKIKSNILILLLQLCLCLFFWYSTECFRSSQLYDVYTTTFGIREIGMRKRFPINQRVIVEVLYSMSLVFQRNNFGCIKLCSMWGPEPGLHVFYYLQRW